MMIVTTPFALPRRANLITAALIPSSASHAIFIHLGRFRTCLGFAVETLAVDDIPRLGRCFAAPFQDLFASPDRLVHEGVRAKEEVVLAKATDVLVRVGDFIFPRWLAAWTSIQEARGWREEKHVDEVG